jgi:hypothetical protein
MLLSNAPNVILVMKTPKHLTAALLTATRWSSACFYILKEYNLSLMRKAMIKAEETMQNV